ncbi:MAG: rod shape-determining protein MreC [Bacteroidetes bacterium]|nr:rod shape-determining protein MreC [Bacteroidota bacterium]
MRNIIFFLYKYYTFLLFLGLELLSFIIIYRYNNYQKASFLNYTGSVSSGFYNAISSTSSYFSLKNVNDSLQAENARLRSQLLNAFYQNSFTATKINDTTYKQQYEYISASVVNNSVTKRNNYITLDKGSDHGIEKGMGVICSNGIVGTVQFVSSQYCVVLSFLNSQSNLSVKVKKNNAFGSLIWEGDDPGEARLKDINKHVKVAVNDDIITSNYSTIYPEGIPVGSISSHYLDGGENFHSIHVKLNTDFGAIKCVYVIRNLFKNQQQLIEEIANTEKH